MFFACFDFFHILTGNKTPYIATINVYIFHEQYIPAAGAICQENILFFINIDYYLKFILIAPILLLLFAFNAKYLFYLELV